MPRNAVVLVIVLVGFVATAACSSHDKADHASKSTVTEVVTTTTRDPNAPDSKSVFPDTPIVSGHDATVNGTFSSGPNPEPKSDPDAADVGCQWVTRADGKRVSVLFPDVYKTDTGHFLIGPPNYQGAVETYDQDPALVHEGDKVIVAGSVDETDSGCTKGTAYPGLTVTSNVWSRA
jgi:hypothetical protein